MCVCVCADVEGGAAATGILMDARAAAALTRAPAPADPLNSRFCE